MRSLADREPQGAWPGLPAERTGAAQPESIIANSVLQARPERACVLSLMGLIAIGRGVREYTVFNVDQCDGLGIRRIGHRLGAAT
jgi:hypothetical protein